MPRMQQTHVFVLSPGYVSLSICLSPASSLRYVYKTKKCVGFPFNCSCDGLDYHREEERRRGPIIKVRSTRQGRVMDSHACMTLIIVCDSSLFCVLCFCLSQYAPTACPNVKPYLNAEWSKPNVDCSGRFKPKIMRNGQLVPQESDEWDCEYAHTLLELMYHPQGETTGWSMVASRYVSRHASPDAPSLSPFLFSQCTKLAPATTSTRTQRTPGSVCGSDGPKAG